MLNPLEAPFTDQEHRSASPIPHQEYQYLNLLKKILKEGKRHENRTGVATRRLLCEVMKFDLSEEFPLLTTKKVYWKGVAHELLWFLSGSTSIKYLKDNNVHIWDGNAKAHYDKIKAKIDSVDSEKAKAIIQFGHGFFDLDDENEIGPVYGYQWRKFNKKTHNPQGPPGFDQISWAIDQIKNNPESRRIIVSAWNPLQIPHMALPPCHVLHKLSVDNDLLHCTVYIRSNDMGLGSPFNIASYALLTCMYAHVCNLKPGTLNCIADDAHIYENHIDAVREQIKREPYPFPKIKINPDKKDMFDIKFEDIELIGYKSHPSIKMDLTV